MVFSTQGHSNSVGGLSSSTSSTLSSSTRSPSRSSILSGSTTTGSGSRFGSARLMGTTGRSNTYNGSAHLYSPRQYSGVSNGRSQYSFMMTPTKSTTRYNGSSKHNDANLFSNLYNSTAELFYPGL